MVLGSDRFLTCSLDGTLRIWNASTGMEIGEPIVDEDALTGIVGGGEEESTLLY